jgi:hypothetical protein
MSSSTDTSIGKLPVNQIAKRMEVDERTAEYLTYAAVTLKDAGFVLKATSMKSEACYYHLPPSKKLIRIAAHRKSRTEIKYGVGKNTVSGITFSQNFIPKSKEAIDKVIYLAVGKYFLSPEPL